MAANPQTQLYDAAFTLKVAKVKSLLKAGASPKKNDREGYDPFYAAVNAMMDDNDPQDIAKQRQIMELMIAHGADVNKVYQKLYGFTPLISAASGGKVGAIAVLLDAGAAIDQGDVYKFTPLMRAALGGRDKAVALLLRRGANQKLKNDSRQDALALAKDGQKESSGQEWENYPAVLKLLQKKK